MNTSQWSFRAILCIALLQLLSCTKNVDTISTDSVSDETSDDLTFPASNEFSNCKLRRIYQSYGEGYDVLNGLFTYNSAGNPVSVLFEPYYADDHFFFYDKQGRLREYRRIAPAGGGETWHFYGYDANNRIVVDTSISHGGADETGQDFLYESRHVSTLTYDSQGRIIKENIRNIYNDRDDMGNEVPLERERNPTYTYDARGNLGVIGWKSSSYDYKVSIFRSHPVFQFIHRNYSKNNSSAQAKYNSRGLPLSVVPGNDVFFNMKNVDKAIYDCR